MRTCERTWSNLEAELVEEDAPPLDAPLWGPGPHLKSSKKAERPLLLLLLLPPPVHRVPFRRPRHPRRPRLLRRTTRRR